MPAKKYATEEERQAARKASQRKSRLKWDRANAERRREYNRGWRESRTPEQKAEEQRRKRERIAADPERLERRRAQTRASYERNKELWILGNIRTRARQQGVPFDLTVADILPPAVCPVLGIPLVRNDQGSKGGPQPNSPAVDRIFPERGYVKGNVIVVSHLANCIKQNATPDQIRRVADFYDKLLSERGIIELRQLAEGIECL